MRPIACLRAIHAGKLEPHEIVARMIEKQVTTNPEPQARKAGREIAGFVE